MRSAALKSHCQQCDARIPPQQDYTESHQVRLQFFLPTCMQATMRILEQAGILHPGANVHCHLWYYVPHSYALRKCCLSAVTQQATTFKQCHIAVSNSREKHAATSGCQGDAKNFLKTNIPQNTHRNRNSFITTNKDVVIACYDC